MTLFSRVTEICRERLPSIRVARITIDSIYDLDKMLQPGIRFGVTVRNISDLVGTPIAYIQNFYFTVDVMDGDERWIIQRMEHWLNGTYKAFYRIFYDEVCQTRLDGVYGEELGWRDAYDVFQLNSQIKSELAKKAGVYNLSVNVPAADGYYTMDKDDSETPYAPDYVPVENRKVGLLITFMSYTGWQTWQYKGIEAVIGEVLEEHWLNPSYWKQKDAESVLTKAAIEEKLTGDIETHTHEHLNQLCELVAVRTAHPDITIEVYDQGAKYYNSLTNLIHTLDYSDEVNPWYYAEQPKVGVLYYSLSDESSSYAKLWRYTGTEMLEIPVHPSLASDVTKQLIESLLTGEIKSHRHPSLNYVLDSSSSQYGYYVMEQGAAMQASKSVPAENRFINLTIYFQTLTAWESWQFIGTDITTQWNNVDYWLKIPVAPSLALGEELGTAYEGSKGKANADAIASISSDLSTAVSKLGGIQENAEVNQNAFSRIKVGSSDIDSDTKTDTFELVGGSNITLSSSGKKITISSSYEDTNHDDLYANKAGDSNQDFTTKNLNVAGYVQVGSARIVYVPEDSDTGTQGYIKIQHADGSTAMHLITTGGQTLYSTGVPAAIEELLLEAHSGVYNLTVNVPPADDFYTLSVMSTEAQYAPTHVPVGVRKNGLIITFRSHSEWETWQFTDAYGGFSAAGNWKRIDAFIEQGVYDMDQQSPLLSGQYYQCSNDDDDHYIPSVIPQGSRVPFMKVRYINSYGQRVILRYASSNFAYFNNYNYWDVLKVSDLSSTDIEKMLTGDISSHTHEHLRDVFRLLYIGGEPPMEDVVTGEQYYDTVKDKIHTAINTEVGGEFLVWDIEGVSAKDNALYVSESDATYNTNKVWLYKEGYMRSLGVVQSQMDNAIFLSKNDEVMVTYNTSENKADIIIGNRVKNRFMVIVPSTTSGVIVVNMIFNSIVPFGFLAEYEIYLYIESENVTNTLLSTECPLEPSETYSSGLILGTLQSTDIIGKGLHKLTYIRDRAAADTHMGFYVKHEYFEKV